MSSPPANPGRRVSTFGGILGGITVQGTMGSNMASSAQPRRITAGLSFSPQLTTDSESITELFNVLFNTVLSRYCEMHEQGVLGNVAFSWLTDAAGDAMDCANNEVNALNANTIRRSATSIGRTSFMKGVDVKYDRGLFEPMIVEYWSLEMKVRNACIYDRLPKNWLRLRQLSFGHTRAKAEALWAFVLAHERVIKESPTLDRFPKFVACIKEVVAEVKDDLKVLQSIQPHQFFYCKHLLAFLVLMNVRLTKLAKFTEQGWLNPGDSEHLREQVHERIDEANNFFPHISTLATPISIIATRSDAGRTLSIATKISEK